MLNYVLIACPDVDNHLAKQLFADLSKKEHKSCLQTLFCDSSGYSVK